MKWLTLISLFILVSCNPDEADLSSIAGVKNTSTSPAPFITFISSPVNGTYKNGDAFSYDFTFSKNVMVEGAPRLKIITEYGTYFAYYSDGSGTNTLRFSYMVPVGVSDDNGITLSPALELNGGSIYDPLEDVDAALNFLPPPTWGILMDGVTPAITSVKPPADGNYSTGQTLEFVLNFPVRVCGYGNPRLQLSIGPFIRFAERVAEPCATTMKFRYTIAADDEDLDGIQLTASAVDLIAPGSAIKDSFGDNAIVTFTNATYPAILVNDPGPPPNEIATLAPASKWYRLNDVLTFSIVFDQNVTVAGGSPYLSIDIGGVTKTASWDPASNGTNSIVFRYMVQATDMDADGITIGSMSYNGSAIRGSNNLPAVFTNSWTYDPIKVDGIVPTISSITIPGNGIYRPGQNLDFTVVWSENVIMSGSYPHIRISIDSAGSPKQAEMFNNTGVITNFRYTLQLPDADFNGISLSTNTLTLPGGSSVIDEAGNQAYLAFPAQTTSGILIAPAGVEHWYDPNNPNSFGTSAGTTLSQLKDLIGNKHANITSSPKWSGAPRRIDFDNAGQQFKIEDLFNFQKIYIVMETKGVSPNYLFFDEFVPEVIVDMSGGTISAMSTCGGCALYFNGTTWTKTTPGSGNFGTYTLNSKKIIMLDYTTNNFNNITLYFGGGYVGYIHEIFILRGDIATTYAAQFRAALAAKHPGAALP